MPLVKDLWLLQLAGETLPEKAPSVKAICKRYDVSVPRNQGGLGIWCLIPDFKSTNESESDRAKSQTDLF